MATAQPTTGLHSGDGPTPAGGLILCGGLSRRMGQPKHLLPWQGQSLLQHVTQVVQAVACPVVVVAGPTQPLPPLPDAVTILRDAQEGAGPLVAVAQGLEFLATRVPTAFVTACDCPWITPALIQLLLSSRQQHEIAVPWDGERLHPLLAAYQTDLHLRAAALLAAGRRSLQSLLDASNTVRVTSEQLQACDPELRVLRSLNSPAEYGRAVQDAAE